MQKGNHFPMAILLRSLHFLLFLCIPIIPFAFAQDENQFIYNGFRQAKLRLDGLAEIHPNGLLQLTNTSGTKMGHAFYQFPVRFRTASSLTSSTSFSTNFVFAMVPGEQGLGGQGIAFTISPSADLTHAFPSHFMGLFNSSNIGLSTNHILAIELDTIVDPEFDTINENHVGIDVNGMKSIEAAPPMYFSDKEGKNISFNLTSWNPMHMWINYDEAENLLNVTLAPTTIPKPNRPLLSKSINLSEILLEYMYVGFSSSTGTLASDHYILGWSFNTSGPAESLDVSSLPRLPRESKGKEKTVVLSLVIAAAFVLITILGGAYILWRKRSQDVREDWEEGYSTHRFTYEDLHNATQGFKDTELLGAGGFGKVYRGRLPSSDVQIAVKRVSHDSKQGMKEFVAEIISMGRMRHRNLVQLLGYCRRKRELILVYDYMANGSLDKFLYRNVNLILNWPQRFRILKGVASGLLYLHEEWEQVVLHRDVKPSNVLLDAELNPRLGDFGLAKLHDHDASPQTTHVVGTIGYLAPELARAGRATTCSDVYAFGTFMLEVACGRKPVEQQAPPERVILVDWVFECWRNGVILDACDPRLEGNYVEEEMVLVLKVGLLCSQAMPAARPSMRQVKQFLDGDVVLPELTKDRAAFSTFKIDESSGFLSSFPSTRTSTPSMSTVGSFLQSGR